MQQSIGAGVRLRASPRSTGSRSGGGRARRRRPPPPVPPRHDRSPDRPATPGPAQVSLPPLELDPPASDAEDARLDVSRERRVLAEEAVRGGRRGRPPRAVDPRRAEGDVRRTRRPTSLDDAARRVASAPDDPSVAKYARMGYPATRSSSAWRCGATTRAASWISARGSRASPTWDSGPRSSRGRSRAATTTSTGRWGRYCGSVRESILRRGIRAYTTLPACAFSSGDAYRSARAVPAAVFRQSLA